MIDQKYQGLGYGTKTLEEILKIIQQDQQHHKIFLGVHKESVAAVQLYQKAGFEFNGQTFGKEQIMMLNY